jgi:hypothetical protein
MGDGKSPVVRRYVLSTPHAPTVARAVVREAFGGRFTQSVVDDAEVVASELMTMLFQRGARGLSVTAAHNGYHAYIEVRADELAERATGEGAPAPPADDLAEKMLSALATDWRLEPDHAWAVIDA